VHSAGSIGKDPDVFGDPERFDAQRWISEAGGDLAAAKNLLTFGFGRRCVALSLSLLRLTKCNRLDHHLSVCPGQRIANRLVLINMALLLWALGITGAPTHPMDPMAFTGTANVHPLPFVAKFEPRIDNLRQLIARAA
jgi:hypothetical protein